MTEENYICNLFGSFDLCFLNLFHHIGYPVKTQTSCMVENFYDALKNAEVTEFLTLPNGATFLGEESLPSSLFIREA